MDELKARIKLAEAMGYTKKYGYWSSPRSKSDIARHGLEDNQLPNPFQDANDCEALILELYERLGVIVQITHGEFDAVEFLDSSGNVIYTDELLSTGPINDYKQGVCELALKVLESE